LQRTFRQVLEDLMPLIEAKSLDVGLLSASDVAVVVDEMDLLTLTKNLLENAIRYTPAAGRIDIQLGLAAGLLIIDIEDSGPGIPLAERQRVFDPFYRVLGQEAVGSGLGLSIVKTIVERLGGTITLSDAHPEALSPGLHVQLALPLPDAEEIPR
jgi:two-component system, OmpR family, sensor kinase